ncbi:hypothetical protein VTK56DRAFT_5454 [Thermocarpiscus australiensis]
MIPSGYFQLHYSVVWGGPVGPLPTSFLHAGSHCLFAPPKEHIRVSNRDHVVSPKPPNHTHRLGSTSSSSSPAAATGTTASQEPCTAQSRLAHAQYAPDRSQRGRSVAGTLAGTQSPPTTSMSFMSQALTNGGVGRDPSSARLLHRPGCVGILRGHARCVCHVPVCRGVQPGPAGHLREGHERVPRESYSRRALRVGCSFSDLTCWTAILRSTGRYDYTLVKWPEKRNGLASGAGELRREEKRMLTWACG